MRRRLKTEVLKLAATRSLAVLLIDMQPHFIDQLALSTVPRLIRAQKKIIHACAEKDVLLVVCEFADYGPTTTHLQEVIARVPRVIVSEKNGDGAFCEPELHLDLQGLSVDTLLLMGINASSCVLDTCDEALELGYKVRLADNTLADWGGHNSAQKSWYSFELGGAEYYSSVELC